MRVLALGLVSILLSETQSAIAHIGKQEHFVLTKFLCVKKRGS